MEWWFYYEHLPFGFEYYSYLIKKLFLIGNFVYHIEG